jgi:hypothetical protein
MQVSIRKKANIYRDILFKNRYGSTTDFKLKGLFYYKIESSFIQAFIIWHVLRYHCQDL